MPRNVAPEREHFGGADGLISETINGKSRYFWRCMHCNWELGGRNFQNNKARIHLSGDPTLRSGLVSRICHAAPDNIKLRFATLERTKRANKASRAEKRRRSQVLLAGNKSKDTTTGTPTKQSRLGYHKKLTAEHVDKKWGEAFFGLDIAPRKVDNPLFRNAIDATKRARAG